MDNAFKLNLRARSKRLFGGDDDDDIDYWDVLEWIILVILLGAAILRFS
jgi:hypothetical protein